tara:strand:+ start:236 stop:1114 length:879 start_codon:yes stop_codon:yes gene_type:complete
LTNFVSSKEQLNKQKNNILDPLAAKLIDQVKWIHLKDFSNKDTELYPVAITGKGPAILLIHGFDSCFLEFRRLVPLLKDKYKLIIPDLYGFGFCPRPNTDNYGLESIIQHLIKILDEFSVECPLGVIGASMGGSVALELARQRPKKIKRLLLLSPAGLCTNSRKIPWPLNQFGVWFLKQSCVRKSLCRQAFANPLESVGPKEEQIASIHLRVPGWHNSLASFARNGGVSNRGKPLPSLPIDVLWGAEDRIIKPIERKKSMLLFNKNLNEIKKCGHLPHLDKANIVAENCLKF